MSKADTQASRHSQQAMVRAPHESQGLKVVRILSISRFATAPHGGAEAVLENVQATAAAQRSGWRWAKRFLIIPSGMK
ncbi:hypothetical protein Q4610_15660 [Sphingobium sp. HBC34]|uniref:Uncharacterized protein n=1 Tax=Sphingobium cyanobacteriorum TaxID=3063954 RepID=A0ABT8ZRA2_9SPHN|nr:hypothetical protein [Sphingobium sp. HBC34]MDO7836484.1 hypothetical protein [Sphingobium sp. HBC34]